MKFSINRQVFTNAVSVVAGAIVPHSPVAILSGIKIEVTPDFIRLTGSDSKITIQTVITPGELSQLNIESTGSIVIESRFLQEIVRKMEGNILEVEQQGESQVEISNDSGKFLLISQPGECYSEIDLERPETHIQMKASQIREIVKQLGHAVSDKETRMVLTGINFRNRDGKMLCSATDSYRLARKTIDSGINEEFSITVPLRSLNEVAKALGDEEDQMIDIYINRKKAQFICNKTMVHTNLLEGVYPDINSIIPVSAKAELVVRGDEFFRMIDRTVLFKEDSYPAVRIYCSEEDVSVKAFATSVGTADQFLSNIEYRGEPMVVAMNAIYLLDAFKALSAVSPADDIHLYFNRELDPVRIVAGEDSDLTLVIVPIRFAG